MKIEQANSVALRDIFAALDIKPTKEKQNDLFYPAPWRNERTASLHVNTRKNVWYDHGEGIGGSVIAFARTYLDRSGNSNTNADIERWLQNITDYQPIATLSKSHHRDSEEAAPVLVRKRITPIAYTALTRYLEIRGISIGIAKQILVEARVFNRDTKRHFFALALKNEEEGYELRNPFFKGSLGPKAITFVRGAKEDQTSIHLFEGMMDYLSIIERQHGRRLEGDAIILNSVSNLKHAFAYIKGYRYNIAYTWFDNDKAGQKSTATFADFVAKEDELKHQPMNAIYRGFDDVNAWHTSKPGWTKEMNLRAE
jgi:hypothetical protein